MKILISAYTGLGNMVLKTPMIRTLAELYPFAQIDLLAGNSHGTENILNNSKYINQTIILKPEETSQHKAVAAGWQYDYFIITFDAAPPFLTKLARQSKVKMIVRQYHPKEIFLRKWKRGLQKNTIWIPLQKDRHEIDLNLDVVETIYKKPIKRNRATFISFKESTAILDKYEITKPYFIMQPGVANGTEDTRKWPTDYFIELIETLLKNYGHPIVLVGDKGDYPSIKPILNAFENETKLINTAGRTTLEELKNLLFFSSLIVCHDSGIMHIADALGKKLIALFGPSDFVRVKPLRKNSYYLFSKTKYFNAKNFFKPFSTKHLPKNVPATYPMSALTVGEVLDKINMVY